MLQLYLANIDFFCFVFHVSLFAFSLNTTFKMSFRFFLFVLLLSRENLNMHFVPFINTFTLFFGGGFTTFFFLILGRV